MNAVDDAQSVYVGQVDGRAEDEADAASRRAFDHIDAVDVGQVAPPAAEVGRLQVDGGVSGAAHELDYVVSVGACVTSGHRRSRDLEMAILVIHIQNRLFFKFFRRKFKILKHFDFIGNFVVQIQILLA